MSLEHLDDFVKSAIESGKDWEGSTDTAESAYLENLAKNAAVKNIGEIGFNAGFSSYTFLAANPNAAVYSFDIGEYEYVKPAKQYIDHLFPGRHHLIVGNSLQTVPEFHKNYPGLEFNLIFIDGGHDYELVKADLLNMRNLAHHTNSLVIDDLTPWKPWGIGPTQAWTELIKRGIVKQDKLYRDGKIVQSIQPPGDRSWALGTYNFN